MPSVRNIKFYTLTQRPASIADLYQVTYGVAEPVVDLIPYMLKAFLQNDRGFVKSGKR